MSLRQTEQTYRECLTLPFVLQKVEEFFDSSQPSADSDEECGADEFADMMNHIAGTSLHGTPPLKCNSASVNWHAAFESLTPEKRVEALKFTEKLSESMIVSDVGDQIDLSKLNYRQKKCIEIVRKKVTGKRGGAIILCGAGGTGKSFVIKALKQIFGCSMAITAPTGLAAVNIGGETLHRFAKLPVKQSFIPLKAERLNQLQATVEPINITNIDEYSMLDGKSHYYYSERMKQGKCSTDNYGQTVTSFPEILYNSIHLQEHRCIKTEGTLMQKQAINCTDKFAML